MKISDLRDKISVRNFITERNERGDILNKVEFERCKVWANVQALNGKIHDAAPERTNKINYRVTIRRREDILPSDEIIWRERRLKLLSQPYLLDGERKFTAFDCEEVVTYGTT